MPLSQTWDGDLRDDREAAVPGLGVGDHEPGEDQRVFRTTQSGERAAVVLQQPWGIGGNLGAADLDVHALLGQVTPRDLGVNPAAADAIQHRHQHIEVIGDPVLFRQHRAGDTGLVPLATEGADEVASGWLGG
jgi:hypothetical protein